MTPNYRLTTIIIQALLIILLVVLNLTGKISLDTYMVCITIFVMCSIIIGKLK
jgi:hypothetical protein